MPHKAVTLKSQQVQFVYTQGEFDAFMANIKPHESLAIDLEFDKDRYQYGFTLCLIQLATAQSCLVIDPFAVKHLKALFEMLEDTTRLKIMHAAGEDLRLFHSLGCFPSNVFDTETAVRFLNYEKSSLGAALEQIFGVQLDKSLQKSNWTNRPLSPEQILYAANDVLYLHQLQAILVEALREKKLLEIVEEENRYAEGKIFTKNAEGYFLSKEEEKMFSEFQRHILNELYIFRDAFAKKYNKPPFQVFSKEFAYEIINTEGQSINQLLLTNGIHRTLRSASGVVALSEVYAIASQQAEENELAHDKNQRRMSAEDYRLYLQQKNKGNRLKEVIAKPIQQWLSQRYGVYAAPNFLSQQLLLQIISDKLKIQDIPLHYKQKVLEEAAQDLGLDLTEFH